MIFLNLKKFKPLIFLSVIVLLVLFFLTLFLDYSLFGNNVALIPLHGEISNDSALFSSDLTAFQFVEKLELAENDSTVSSILIEINSPGGQVVATKQIVEKIRSIDKPVVAWISDIGASGGYYVASASDLIISDEDSITGSIGVISVVADYSELFEKIGLKFEVLKKGEHKDIGSPFSSLDEEERKIFQTLLDQTFENFVNDIKQFRGEKLNTELFEQIIDGRILSGTQAKEIGLVDELGSRDYAIKRAGELGGITEKPFVKDFSNKEKSVFDLFSNFGFSLGAGFKKGISYEPLTIKS